LPVAIFCAFLLLAPNWLLEKVDIRGFVSSSKGIVSLTLLFSLMLYGYEKGKKLTQFLKKRRATSKNRRASMRAIANRLDGLSPQEEAWVYYCLKENPRTLIATVINATAISLLSKLIVFGPNTPHDSLATPFTIREEVWAYLVTRKEIYCPPTRLDDLEYNR
jgi:hypothetical protein